MMDKKDWLVLPEEPDLEELGEEESYAKLLVLMHEAPSMIEQGIGRRLSDRQARAIQRLIAGLIDSKARVRASKDE